MRHYNKNYRQKRAFTLVELLVVIAIIGTLVALLLPAVQAARESARSNTCRNNLSNLQKAIANRESSLGTYPGYANNLGVKGTVNQIRASWVVMTFPYIEQTNLWELWSQPNTSDNDYLRNLLDQSGELELLICPSDPPVTTGEPHLSYVANAGWIGRSNSQLPASPPSLSPFGSTNEENGANGIFFDLSRRFDTNDFVGPVNAFEPQKPVSITAAYIGSKGDGSTSTMLLTENMHAVYWAYGEESDYTSGGAVEEKYHFGFCWEQPDTVVDPSSSDDEKKRRINGEIQEDSYTAVSDITNGGAATELRTAFPSSRHPGGVNIAFVGGSVKFVADQLEPRVYAQLMTSNRNKSDLVFGGNQEKNMDIVSDDDF